MGCRMGQRFGQKQRRRSRKGHVTRPYSCNSLHDPNMLHATCRAAHGTALQGHSAAMLYIDDRTRVVESVVNRPYEDRCWALLEQ